MPSNRLPFSETARKNAVYSEKRSPVFKDLRIGVSRITLDITFDSSSRFCTFSLGSIQISEWSSLGFPLKRE
ncbi:MAG: hypothetical protein HQK91_03675 [Nitrospirae bacterium]|nr:hypothetical protein [Nitrospirota bacterium]MBF0540536.1 hypothetical protein [Nitrospirota bacterium]